MKKRLLPIFLAVVMLCTMLFSQAASAVTYDPGQTFETRSISLWNLDTGIPVYEKDADAKMYPASTTKIMTYIVAVEAIADLENTVIRVSQKAISSLDGTGSSLAGVYLNEDLTALQLLHLMMIPSGNDAAAVLAYYVGDGSEEAFVEKMNEKAQELGCTNTHFANAHGLHDPDHYTTANDMAKIAQYAMMLPYFTEITNKTFYELPPTNQCNESRTVVTTNKMLLSSEPTYYYTYAQGIKTGTTDQAGYCLVSSAVYEGTSYLCVALGAPSVDKDGEVVEVRKDMVDSANLYRWAFTQLSLKTIADANTPAAEIPLKYVWGKDTILLAPEKNLLSVLPQEVNPSSVMVETDLPESLSAPLRAGDIVGTATYTYAGETLGKVNIVVTEDVARNEVLVVLDVVCSVVFHPIFIICFVLAIILLILYIVLIVRYNRKKQQQAKRSNRYKNHK